MYLLNLDYEHIIDVLVHYEFGQCVLMLPVCITQRNLLIILMIQADGSVIEEFPKVFELDPEYAIQFIVDTNLIFE